MLAAARTGYWKLRRWSGLLLIAGLILLIAVWLPGLGIVKNGAHRWIGHDPFNIQPSEFAKLAVIIYLAALLSRATYNIGDLADGLIVPVCVIGLFVVLIEREPDLGTASILFLASLTVLYLAGAQLKHLASVVGVAFTLFVVVSLFGHSFRNDRIRSFMDPEKDYYGQGFQVTRGLVAVGSGGLFGVGIGAGREKVDLPEANSDFIFATITEETGL